MRPPGQSIEITQVVEWRNGEARQLTDYLAAEEPLEIRIVHDGSPPVSLSVTMRTPGHDHELTAGFLLTEGILSDVGKLHEIRTIPHESTGKRNIVEVEIIGADYDPEQSRRNFFATSSCGICGKASIEAVRARGLHRPNPDLRISPQTLASLVDKLRCDQAVFDKTGGLHAAGLFSAAGELLGLREDIGRHNAVDKIVGWALLEGRLPLSEQILMVSGRGGFEIVQKSIAAGIPVLASVSAPSNLAVKLAREMGLTLIGFLRGERFVIYSGAERILKSPQFFERKAAEFPVP
jgi:FdhD protein